MSCLAGRLVGAHGCKFRAEPYQLLLRFGQPSLKVATPAGNL